MTRLSDGDVNFGIGTLSYDPEAKRRRRHGNIVASKESRYGQTETASGSSKS